MPEIFNASDVSAGRVPALEDAKEYSRMEAERASQNGMDGVELLLILARHKATILKVTIGATLIAAIVMFLVPNTYTATSSILPPEQKQSTLGAMLGQLGSMAGLSESDLGLKNPGDLFIGMLHSRTIQDRLIDKFDLRKVYKVSRY